MASAGDINGDGFADLIIGAFGADPQGSYSGASYVVFGGGCPRPRWTAPATAAAQTLAGGDFNDTLAGLGGDERRLYGHVRRQRRARRRHRRRHHDRRPRQR